MAWLSTVSVDPKRNADRSETHPPPSNLCAPWLRKKVARVRRFWHLSERPAAARRTVGLVRDSAPAPAAWMTQNRRSTIALLLAALGTAGGVAACRESKTEPGLSHPQVTANPPTRAESDGGGASATTNTS